MSRSNSTWFPCPYDYPANCTCVTCENERKSMGRPVVDTYDKYSSSYDNDTGLMQTDFFHGTVGESNQRKKVHVAIDEYGNVVYVRDIDGRVLYDKKNNIGYLPIDLNWSRF